MFDGVCVGCEDGIMVGVWVGNEDGVIVGNDLNIEFIMRNCLLKKCLTGKTCQERNVPSKVTLGVGK